jgi:hypothetical protein
METAPEGAGLFFAEIGFDPADCVFTVTGFGVFVSSQVRVET